MKKTNNKGFSLVELIIVIAIMAILVGVLAPQYIKYVEKSRKSADEDCADSILNAAMTACTDEDYIDSIGNSATITFNSSGVTTSDAGLTAGLNEYFSKWQSCKVKSKTYKSSTYTVTISMDSSNALKATGTW